MNRTDLEINLFMILPYSEFFSQTINYSFLVRSCKPCHLLISSFKISLTNLCCLTIERPWNFSLVTSIENIDPHPPLMSLTVIEDGFSSLLNLSVISFSSGVKEYKRRPIVNNVLRNIILGCY